MSGKVRDHDVPFPFNIRRNVGIWKWLFMDGKPFVPDAARSAQWNRGAYLVNSLGHCAECHSPRNFLGGIIAAQRFAGGPDPEGRGLGAEHHAEGNWRLEREGHRLFPRDRRLPEGDSAGGSMARVIKNTSQLSDRGSRGDRGISQVAAAGGGTAAAAEEGDQGQRQVLS